MARGDTISIILEFGGGSELLTATKKTKKHSLQLPAHVSPNQFQSPVTAITPSTQPIGNGAGDDADQASNAKGDATATGATIAHNIKMRDLIQFVCRDIVTERHSMLVEPDGSIRPGILVLINDADWELEGEMEYEIQDGDHICMISTLHGG